MEANSLELAPPPERADFSGPLGRIRYTMALSDYVASRTDIRSSVILRELVFLGITRQFKPSHYFETRLWRRDLSMKQKMRFLNDRQYIKRVRQINPIEYERFSHHKLVEKSILSLLGVPTPRFIGFFHPDKGCSPHFGALTDAAELSQLLSSQDCRKLCFKRAEGWAGAGFVAAAVSLESGRPLLRNLAEAGEELEVSAFIERYLRDSCDHGFVMEDYIEQHEVMSSLNPSSVNTLRIWVRQKGQSVRLIGAVLRMGRQSQVVDNTTCGGVISLVNLDSGISGPLIIPSLVPEIQPCHPDSGTMLEGLQLPYWPEILALAEQTMRIFPEARFAGLDIAVGTQGPLVVELNLRPDKVSARNFGAPTADLLA